MSTPTPAEQGNSEQKTGKQPAPVLGQVSDQPGDQGNVPAGTEPMGQEQPVLAPTEEDTDKVEVVLAHHWTDPETGRTYGPRQSATVSSDMANSLRGARYLLSDADVETMRAEAEQASEQTEPDQQTETGKDQQKAAGRQTGSDKA